MSSTLIYAVKQDEEPISIGQCRNAFRGAMYVWSDIAKRHFGLESFPHFDEDMQRRVWNAGNEKPLTTTEIIVLASTMDKAIVDKAGIDGLLTAFKEYGENNENSSISDQAELIEKNLGSIPDGYSIAWIQTSVCGDRWFGEWDEEKEIYTCDLSQSFEVMQQAKEVEEYENY